jgi:hypothetical protein
MCELVGRVSRLLTALEAGDLKRYSDDSCTSGYQASTQDYLDDTAATELSEGLVDVAYSDLTGGMTETIWKQENGLRKYLQKVNARMRNLLSTIFEVEEKYISPFCQLEIPEDLNSALLLPFKQWHIIKKLGTEQM